MALRVLGLVLDEECSDVLPSLVAEDKEILLLLVIED